MDKTTFQEKQWAGDLGKEYTADIAKNPMTVKGTDKLYIQFYGVSRTKLNEEFIGKFKRSIKILEVGCNIGVQLLYLQRMGFKNLYGIEPNKYAIGISKTFDKTLNIIEGSAFDIPFKDKYFDLVFTSGLLIHISPTDIKKVMKEIYRCTKKYIWGFEYYSPNYVEIPYRGNKNMLWKGDFAKKFLNFSRDLKLVKEKKLKYLNSENIDTMFLLKKNGRR